jgi:hypothetical protein
MHLHVTGNDAPEMGKIGFCNQAEETRDTALKN